MDPTLDDMMPEEAETHSPGNRELCIPTSAVRQESEGGEDFAEPEPGDTVAVTVEGTVTRAAGGKTYIRVTKANGEPIPEEKAEPGLDDLEAAAAAEVGGAS